MSSFHFVLVEDTKRQFFVFLSLQPAETVWATYPDSWHWIDTQVTRRTPKRHPNISKVEIPSLISCLTSYPKKGQSMPQLLKKSHTYHDNKLQRFLLWMCSWGHFLNVPLQQPNFFTYLAVETSLQSFHAKISILLHFPNHHWSIISRAKKLGKKSFRSLSRFPWPCAPLGTSSHPSGRPSRKPRRTVPLGTDPTRNELSWKNSCQGRIVKVRWWCGKMRKSIFFNFDMSHRHISSAGSLYRKLPVVSKIRKNLGRKMLVSRLPSMWKELYISNIESFPSRLRKKKTPPEFPGDPSGTAFSSSSSSEPQNPPSRTRHH